jgi:hypothetical protein
MMAWVNLKLDMTRYGYRADKIPKDYGNVMVNHDTKQIIDERKGDKSPLPAGILGYKVKGE